MVLGRNKRCLSLGGLEVSFQAIDDHGDGERRDGTQIGVEVMDVACGPNS